MLWVNNTTHNVFIENVFPWCQNKLLECFRVDQQNIFYSLTCFLFIHSESFISSTQMSLSLLTVYFHLRFSFVSVFLNMWVHKYVSVAIMAQWLLFLAKTENNFWLIGFKSKLLVPNKFPLHPLISATVTCVQMVNYSRKMQNAYHAV